MIAFIGKSASGKTRRLLETIKGYDLSNVIIIRFYHKYSNRRPHTKLEFAESDHPTKSRKKDLNYIANQIRVVDLYADDVELGVLDEIVKCYDTIVLEEMDGATDIQIDFLERYKDKIDIVTVWKKDEMPVTQDIMNNLDRLGILVYVYLEQDKELAKLIKSKKR
jgi:hypothetical protein